MGRLIDADVLIKAIQQHMVKINSLFEEEKTVVEIIDAQPTAYDVDKVVEELEEWTFEADVIMPRGDIVKNNKLISSGNATDIVRKGGVE